VPLCNGVVEMQVVLISPYSEIEATGLRILSACLKRAGFNTHMVFLPDLRELMAGASYDERVLSPTALRQIVDLCANAGLVGITVMTSSFHLARQLTEYIHATLKVPIIWGGIHPTVCPHECLRYADLVCIGEGERAIVELAQRIAGGLDYGDIRNLARPDQEGRTLINPLNPLESDLDQLPFPDYEFEGHHVLHDGRLTPFSQSLMHYYLTDLGSWARGPLYRVLTTRGCPYRCAYCANNALADIYPDWCKLRHRSPGSVIAEIQAARARLPSIQAIIIHDDNFLAHTESYIIEFCQRYRQEVGLPFRAYTTAQTANPVKLQYLVDAGLKYVLMGIQTGSGSIQKLYQRMTTNDQILHAAQVIHSFQPRISRPMYHIITDNPYETDDDRYETLQLVHRLLPPYRLTLFSLIFYPGTDLYSRAKTDRLVEDADPSLYTRNFQIVKPNYYNFALLCHSLNLPRPFLYLVTRRIVFRLFSWGLLNRLCGLLLNAYYALRLRMNSRLFSRRRSEWLALWADSPR
jgi:anaerobic magnesium-protoporphyrin IX monomethyl ester cyclase